VRSGPGAARTILLFHTISARPPSLVWYVPSFRYTRGLGWRMHCGAEVTESSTNKQHHLSACGWGTTRDVALTQGCTTQLIVQHVFTICLIHLYV
jgi:hypothetical protein